MIAKLTEAIVPAFQIHSSLAFQHQEKQVGDCSLIAFNASAA